MHTAALEAAVIEPSRHVMAGANGYRAVAMVANVLLSRGDRSFACEAAHAITPIGLNGYGAL